jgi:2-hydroxychromene-2-carboxylate isomerase
MPKTIRVYTDYKSPYAYVANQALFDLERTHDVSLEWLPYTLRIAEYLGSVEGRNAHDWRKVRYAYMDARRSANAQGLILKGPKRIYNGYYSSVGMLFAQKRGFFRTYHDAVFEMFWTHRLDIDAIEEMKAVIARLGGSAADYESYAEGFARDEHETIITEAESLGVFGVPSMLLDGELFWGGDRIDMLRARLEEQRAR